MRLKRILVAIGALAATSAFLSFGCSDSSSEPKSEPLRNRVYMPTNLEVKAGTRFAVPVYFDNVQPVRAMTVPLTYSAESVECDSISFVASRVSDWLFDYTNSINEQRLVQIAVLDTVSIDTGRGLLATLYFWAHGNSPETDMIIDTTRILPTIELHFADTSQAGILIIPEFTAGRVHISSQL